MILGNLTCAIRFEVDAVNESGKLVELKCKTKPNTRYGLGTDYFLNIWIQMVLSDTPYLKIGIHDKGVLTTILNYSLQEVQREAGVNDKMKSVLFQKLNEIILSMHSRVDEGRQAVFTFTSQSPTFTCQVLKVNSFNLPLVSPEMRRRVLQHSIDQREVAPVKKSGTGVNNEASSLKTEEGEKGTAEEDSLELAMGQLKLGGSSVRTKWKTNSSSALQK